MSDPLIRIRNLHRIHGEGEAATHALRGMDLDIGAGEFVVIVGASGSGKFTLMNIIGLLDQPSAGSYRLAGRDVAALTRDQQSRLRSRRFGFVFQQYHLIPGLSAIGNVEVPAIHAGSTRQQSRTRAASLLGQLGLGARLHAHPTQMSGGQQQRVSIARALMNGGEILLADEPTGALDRDSAAEVMRLLTDLAAAGHTVILITHDPEVAAQAERVIRIADGTIAEDSGPVRPMTGLPHVAGGKGGTFGASLREAARSALWALLASPVRTALTLGGIVIGVASVVAMMAIGRGAQEQYVARASSVGTNWVVVLSDQDKRMPRQPLTPDDAGAMRDLPNVLSVMPGRWEQALIRHGAYDAAGDVIGTDTDFRMVYGWDAARGSFFSELDERAGSPVLLLGATIASKLFPDGGDPTGKFVLVNNAPFLVSGVMERKGVDEDGEDRDNVVVMPLRSLESRLYGAGELSVIVIALSNMALLTRTVADIRAALTERHRAEDFWLYDAASAFSSAVEARDRQNLLLGAIAAISILVGGIGVMNIMFITVGERTREIGIRSATGAATRDILIQFLTEAVVLSAIGACVGLALAGAIGAVAAFGFGMPVVFSAPWRAQRFWGRRRWGRCSALCPRSAPQGSAP